MAARLNAWLYRIVAATRFPQVRDADAMQDWIGFVRIAVGVVAFIRVALIAESSRFYFPGGTSWTGVVNAHATELALFELALLTLLIIGLATPLAIVALLGTCYAIDVALGTATLGTYVFTLVLVFLLLSGAGARVSVDARLGRRVRRLYVIGAPDERQLTVYLFGLFAAYGLVSFGALLHHMSDEYWQEGKTVAVMLTSSYLARLWHPARELQEWQPWLMDAFSRIAVIGQTIFQLGMVVLVKWRWGLYFVIAWGGMFILISAVALQLSYLPYVELCVWALLWVRPRAQAAVDVLYDDRCNLCRGTVRTLRALDPLRTFAFLPLSTHGGLAERYGATAEDILEDLHGVRRGTLLRGYDLYRALARSNPLLWPLVPVLELGRITRVGPLVYRAVARRRRRLFGTCELGGAPEPKAAVPAPRQRPRTSAVATTLLALVCATMILRFEPLQGLWRSVGLGTWPAPIERATRDVRLALGFVEPNVFNAADLRMGEQWWTATWEAPDGRRGSVPLNREDGSRAAYHRSDILYFGNSLPWRRRASQLDLVAANAPAGELRPLIDKALAYHHRREGDREPWRYTVRLYRDRSADVSVPPRARYRAEQVDQFDAVIG